MIDIKNLSFRYNNDSPYILDKLSLCVPNNSILTILGQNGIGKTTFIKCLTAELKSYEGVININSQEVRSLLSLDLSKMIAVVASNSPCYQNLCVAEYLVTGFTNQMAAFQAPNNLQYEKAESILESFGKAYLFNKNIYEISSGEMQIVRIARAVLQNPQIIIFDEPTATLDVKNQLIVLEQISSLHEKGYTIITTTHNPGHAIELNGYTLALFNGKYIFGETGSIINSDNFRKIYNLSVKIANDINRQYAVFSNKENSHHLYY